MSFIDIGESRGSWGRTARHEDVVLSVNKGRITISLRADRATDAGFTAGQKLTLLYNPENGLARLKISPTGWKLSKINPALSSSRVRIKFKPPHHLPHELGNKAIPMAGGGANFIEFKWPWDRPFKDIA